MELETNPFRAGDERVENARSNLSHTHTHTQLATSDFHTDLRPRSLLLTSTHLRKRQYHALVLTSEYTLHAQVIHTQ